MNKIERLIQYLRDRRSRRAADSVAGSTSADWVGGYPDMTTSAEEDTSTVYGGGDFGGAGAGDSWCDAGDGGDGGGDGD
ncbi:hypothetical protein [Aridibaculum aurantiacum]|uniref:hypothetical protein n=1 Tax=Aridibaculum aurantiacum TaxID=2810307 RepID=UPI001A97971E|nr:hypothetical protein [Aridibaculum aurantiacum]